MGVTMPYEVTLPGGLRKKINMADCVNIARTPKARELILQGKFNRIPDEDGKGVITIEKEFFYTDFERQQLFLVKPRFERHTWLEASARLERMLNRIPETFSIDEKHQVRVIFGLAELREKLIAMEAGMDDRMVELFKVLLIQDHPFLIKKPRLRILLEKKTPTDYKFIACYDHHPAQYRIGLPSTVVDYLTANQKDVIAWVNEKHKHDSIFQLKNDHWINFWRWSPAPAYLNMLKEFAADIRRNKVIKTNSRNFRNMLKFLPRGSQLPSWAKKDLETVFQYAKRKKNQSLQDRLFEIRFDKELDDDWHLNESQQDIPTIWKLLRDLPETNVEGNTLLDEINLVERADCSWYNPDTRDIYIRSEDLKEKEWFEDVLRHEVGHAVHEKMASEIDNWLKEEFGWEIFDGYDDQEIDAWIEKTGGYGNITSQEKRETREYIKEYFRENKNPWGPPDDPPKAPAGHPWNDKQFAPRLIAEQTGENWHEVNERWYRHNGKAFFFNFYYAKLMIVNEGTLSFINEGMKEKYAATSPHEFFAELYALYFDLDDKNRKNIPKKVLDWMEQHVGKATKKP
jgi:hypothetical protein